MVFAEKRIADIGCGTGHLLRYVVAKYNTANVTGFEYSSEALKFANTICPSARLAEFDIYQGTNETFDVLICTEVLEHLLHPDLALKNILSMLAPGGNLCVTVPDGRVDTFLGHINFWSPESWKVFIESHCTELSVQPLIINGSINCAIIKRK